MQVIPACLASPVAAVVGRDVPSLFWRSQTLNEYQARHKVDRLPSLLEYLGFAFCCGNLLAGPFVEYTEYKDCIEEKGVSRV